MYPNTPAAKAFKLLNDHQMLNIHLFSQRKKQMIFSVLGVRGKKGKFRIGRFTKRRRILASDYQRILSKVGYHSELVNA